MKTRILVVDDEESILELLSSYLGRYDYEVLTARTAAEACQLANQEAPRLVILDVVLPDANGMEALSAIKATHANLPVVILTGIGSDEELTQEAQKRGAAGYVSKAVPLDQLLMEVRRILNCKLPPP